MRGIGILWSAIVVAGCAGDGTPRGDTRGDLTSIGGTVWSISWDGYVYVDPAADVPTIQATIARQVKSALGALREQSIGIEDRAALHNLDPAGWTRDTLAVVDAQSGAWQKQLQRVRYHYGDTALVANTVKLPTSDVSFTVMLADYTQPALSASLQPACVDEATDADSFWYHFQPGQPACQKLIQAENQTVSADETKLNNANQLSSSDAQRNFLTLRAKLVPQAAAPTKYPEYDRLWGFGSDRQKVIAYAFVGVESDEHDSHDLGAVEYQRLLRTLMKKWPKLQVVDTQPFAMLLDFSVDGQQLTGVTWADVQNWMIDDQGYPAQVGSDATKIESLRQQVIENFSERFIVWQLPVTVRLGSETRSMTVELHTFWGVEDDGTDETRQRAIWRYLEAFWYGDLFAYAGHSHFGNGPLEPTNYQAGNFPDRYQVMLFNSCLSYNYYDLDFLAMHPEGSRDLEVVVNALPAYWNGMGESTGDYLVGLLDGNGKSYAQLLDSMKIVDPFGQPGYEPMRGVNGELDNVYDPTTSPLVVQP